MDKAWIHLPRMTEEYRNAVQNFVYGHAERKGNPEKIICPCSDCRNLIRQSPREVVSHLICFGIDPTYDVWIFHGEARPTENEDDEATNTYRMYLDTEICNEEMEDHANVRHGIGIKEIMENAEIPLYPGCASLTKLSATILLYKHKARNGVSDTAFTELLQLLLTREFAKQVHADFEFYGAAVGLSACSVYGGTSMHDQQNTLKCGVDIVVGTPRRIKDLINKNVLDLKALKFCVLDEADEMLNMGFVDDVEFILGPM